MHTFFSETLTKQVGINLLEMLIALSMAGIMCNMLLFTYSGVSQSSQFQQHIKEFQYKAQRITTILTTAIKQAGFIGCAHLTNDLPVASSTAFNITVHNKLAGTADKLIVRYAESISNAVQNISNTRVVVDDAILWRPNSILVMHDCRQIEIFVPQKITRSKSQQVLILRQPLHFIFPGYAEVSRLNINHYFLGNTKKRNADGSFIRALYVKDIHQRQIELVSGIQALRFHYYIKRAGQLQEILPQDQNGTSLIVAVSIEVDIQVANLKRPWFIWVALQS